METTEKKKKDIVTTIAVLFSSRKITFIENENNCWEWTSHKLNRDGYPTIRQNGPQHTMSRWLFEQIHGPLGKNLVVRHKCDNPACINPDHLIVGSIQDNVRDMVERGRSPNRKGTKNGRAKLNEVLIPEIIKRLSNFELQKNIARDLGVSQQMISRIKKGEAWKSVLGDI